MDVTAYGLIGDGKTANDDAFAGLVEAVRGQSHKGGRVFFPPGAYAFTREIDLDGVAGLTLDGESSPVASDNGGSFAIQPAAYLMFKQAGAGFGIRARSVNGLRVRNLGVFYDNPAFTGTLIYCGHGPAGYDSTVRVEGCSLGGVKFARGAAALVALPNCICSSVRGCTLGYAQRGVTGFYDPPGGTGCGYSNVVNVERNVFTSIRQAPIYNPHIRWTVAENTVEGIDFDRGDGCERAVLADRPGMCQALRVVGNWFGDINGSPGDAWLELSDVYATTVSDNHATSAPLLKVTGSYHGLSVRDNYLQGSQGAGNNTAVQLSSQFPRSSEGLVVEGNFFLFWDRAVSGYEVHVDTRLGVNSYSGCPRLPVGYHRPTEGLTFDLGNQSLRLRHNYDGAGKRYPLDLDTNGQGAVRLRRSTVHANAPTNGTWEKDAVLLSASGILWVCDVAGAPGTWRRVSR